MHVAGLGKGHYFSVPVGHPWPADPHGSGECRFCRSENLPALHPWALVTAKQYPLPTPSQIQCYFQLLVPLFPHKIKETSEY